MQTAALAKQKYEMGDITFLEYSQATKNVATTELNLIQKAYEIKISAIKLLLFTDRINTLLD